MGWIDKLKNRWKLESGLQVIMVLVVFACTGFTVLYLKRPIVNLFTQDGETNIWFSVIYYILILPIYNVVLLFYGFIFGQFRFFWEFEKRTYRRIVGKKDHAE